MNKPIRIGKVVEVIDGNWGKIVYPSRSSVFTVNAVRYIYIYGFIELLNEYFTRNDRNCDFGLFETLYLIPLGIFSSL